MIEAKVNPEFPNVVEIDADRAPLTIRIMRLGQRHDRLRLVIDERFINVVLQHEGDDIAFMRSYVDDVPLPEPTS